MKYKLKKDINGAKAGTEFEYDKIGKDLFSENIKCIALVILIGIDNEDYFEKVEEKKTIHNLGMGDTCYFINNNDAVVSLRISEPFLLTTYRRNLEYGNIFLTREEGQRELDVRRAKASIAKRSTENDGEMNRRAGFFIGLEVDTNKLKVQDETYHEHYGRQYYSSEKKAKQALKELEAEYKILFDID